MARTPGWVVATTDSELAFVDCQGRTSMLGGARVETSTTRCRTSPARLDLTAVVRSVDRVRRIVRAEDGAGRGHVFYIPADVAGLANVEPGVRIRATGPIAGQATAIIRSEQ